MSGAAESIAVDFLQTVVVIDDHAYSPILPEAEIATLGGESPGGFVEDVEDVEDVPPDPEDFDTKVVVEGFADLGIACAVISPSAEDPDQDSARLLRLAGRADVVVLDWLIRPLVPGSDVSSGLGVVKTSVELLIDILKEDDRRGSRLRLVCVYTGRRDLEGVRDEIEGRLHQVFPDVVKRTGSLILDVNAARIMLIPKFRIDPLPGSTPVPAAALPTVVVQAFDQFASNGILPRLALASLSSIRRRAHRLLWRFSADLDPALITHRSLTTALDAQEFALALVGNELGAVLEAEGVADVLEEDEVNSSVAGYMEGRAAFWYWKAFVDGGTAKQLAASDVKLALDRGVDGDNGNLIRGSTVKLGDKASLTSLMIPHQDEAAGSEPMKQDLRRVARDIDFRFSALSSLSRDPKFDGDHMLPPQLNVGAIVHRPAPQETAASGDNPSCGLDNPEGNLSGTPADAGSTGSDSASESAGAPTLGAPHTEFWMCVQPLCDSVRLHVPTKFPFIRLVACTDKSEGFDLVGYRSVDGYTPLLVGPRKLGAVDFFEFAPDQGRHAVRAEWTSPDGWCFVDAEGRRFEWIGHVRVDKAQTLLAAVVVSAGRIGLNEYEYLRRVSRV